MRCPLRSLGLHGHERRVLATQLENRTASLSLSGPADVTGWKQHIPAAYQVTLLRNRPAGAYHCLLVSGQNGGLGEGQEQLLSLCKCSRHGHVIPAAFPIRPRSTSLSPRSRTIPKPPQKNTAIQIVRTLSQAPITTCFTNSLAAGSDRPLDLKLEFIQDRQREAMSHPQGAQSSDKQ